ncbi:amidohydrolase family protein [Streptomyces sp. NPDC058961]|uniref:amidohydrolase family protein n=1 Tax=Streptomyces sp. NPDC058961 TaxID=3346680 RepID=UPI0036747C7E
MLICAGRVLTGGRGQYLTDGAVLIKDGLIAAVGSRDEIEAQAPADVPRLHYPAGTLMPGLIDAHVHLVFDGGADPVASLEQQDDEALLKDMRARAEQLVRIGVTTARDLGDRGHLALRLAQEIEQGTAAGPRIISAGIPATPPGGHCWFLGGEVSGEQEIRELVRRNADAGARVIKVMETGGGLTKGGAKSHETQFAPADLATVVDAARAAGLPVAAHAHGVDGITAAVQAGVDTIEHCTWMTEDGIEVHDDVLDEIVAKGIHVCPAVSPHWKMLPRFFGPERAQAMFDAVQRMAEAGVRLIAGTDAGVQRAGHDGLVAALEFYEHLGVPNERILEMATSEAADALGVADTTGQIEVGYSADILVVDGDPLTDLTALGDVRAVFARGVRCYRPGQA